MKITANVVTIDESQPLVIGFADDAMNPEVYVVLSADKPNQKGGLHVCVNDEARSGYNLVERVCLGERYLRLILTNEGERVLESGPEIEINVSSQVPQWASLKERIQRVLTHTVPVEICP